MLPAPSSPPSRAIATTSAKPIRRGSDTRRCSMRSSPPRPPPRRAGVRVRIAQHLRGRFSRKTLVVDIVIAVVITALIAFVVFNAQSGEKKIQQKIERLYSTEDPQFLHAMGVLLGPPVAGRQPLSTSSSTATRSFRRCWPRSAARRRRSPSRPTSTGRATIGKEFADALAERARAGVKVHVLLDWLGSSKIDEALDRRDEVGRRRGPDSTTRRTGATSAGSTTAPTARCWSSTAGSASPAASASPTSGAATPRIPSTGATRTSASRARSSRRCRRCSWTTGSRPPARCCTAPTTSRRSSRWATARRRCSAARRAAAARACSSCTCMPITAAKRSRSACRAAYFVPDELARRRRWSRRRSAA